MITLSKAKAIAINAGNKMLPYCDRLNIAGSIRRGRPEVGDIEIICQPKKVSTGAVDLWEQDTRQQVVHPEFVKVVRELGTLIKGKPDGRQMQIELKDLSIAPLTIMLDLFMPEAYDYYRVYATRTGSSDYSNKVIATAWVKKGWVGTKDGLRLRTECEGKKGLDGKTVWRCVTKAPELPPAWQSEQEFFDWLKVAYLPPNLRTVTVLL